MTHPLAALGVPLRIKEHEEAFLIRDAAETSVAAVYFDDGCDIRRHTLKRMTKATALEIAKTAARAIEDAVRVAKDG